jgi:hypothetical protein
MIESQMDRAAIENVVALSNSRLDMWTRLINLAEVRRLTEIGVWKGEFAEAVLRACPTVQSYFMIDAWRRLDQWNKPMNIDDHAFEAIYEEALQRTGFASDRRTALRGTTLEVICDIPDESLDLAYIDDDHTLRGVTIDLIACYQKVKPGHYLGGDDFCPTIWQHSLKFEPTLVFPFAVNFAEAMGATIYCLPFNQFLMQKGRNGQRRFAVIDFTGQYREPSLLPQLSLQTLIAKAVRERLPGPIEKILRWLRQKRRAKAV